MAGINGADVKGQTAGDEKRRGLPGLRQKDQRRHSRQTGGRLQNCEKPGQDHHLPHAPLRVSQRKESGNCRVGGGGIAIVGAGIRMEVV